MSKHTLLVLTAAILLGVASCKKEENNPPTPKNSAPVVEEPSDASIFFKTVRFFTSQTSSLGQSVDYQIGDAYATFRDSLGIKISAGTVTINGLELTNQANNYFFGALDNIPGGVDYPNDVANWVCTGDTNTGFLPLSVSDNTSFPAKPVIKFSEVNTQASFLLAAKDSIVADSTIFILSGPTGTLRKVRGPNARSVAFTKEEMVTLGTGRSLGLVQISPYNLVLDTNTLPGKKMYFLKQTIASKYVDFE